jgi:hypothetical protein
MSACHTREYACLFANTDIDEYACMFANTDTDKYACIFVDADEYACNVYV